jgi:anti-anti-sigma factor
MEYMKADVKAVGENVVVSLKGSIDYETSEKFAKDIKKKLPEAYDGEILIDMQGLDFVGSSHIGKFLEIIRATFGETAKCIGVKKEFKRCFNAFSPGGSKFRYYTSVEEALTAFDADVEENFEELPLDRTPSNC